MCISVSEINSMKNCDKSSIVVDTIVSVPSGQLLLTNKLNNIYEIPEYFSPTMPLHDRAFFMKEYSEQYNAFLGLTNLPPALYKINDHRLEIAIGKSFIYEWDMTPDDKLYDEMSKYIVEEFLDEEYEQVKSFRDNFNESDFASYVPYDSYGFGLVDYKQWLRNGGDYSNKVIKVVAGDYKICHYVENNSENKNLLTEIEKV